MSPRHSSQPPDLPPDVPRTLEPEVMATEAEARDYDQMNHAEVNARFVEDLLKLPADLSSVLDVGTGTAQIPITLCRRSPNTRVVAVDLSLEMLKLAQVNVGQAALGASIELRQQDAKALEFADRSFQTVISNSTAHHIERIEDHFAEMIRVLSRGGWLFVRDLSRPPDEQRLFQLVQQYAGDANVHQRQMFENSLRAAVRPDEIVDILGTLGIRGASISMTSDRHWTLTWKKP